MQCWKVGKGQYWQDQSKKEWSKVLGVCRKGQGVAEISYNGYGMGKI